MRGEASVRAGGEDRRALGMGAALISLGGGGVGSRVGAGGE